MITLDTISTLLGILGGFYALKSIIFRLRFYWASRTLDNRVNLSYKVEDYIGELEHGGYDDQLVFITVRWKYWYLPDYYIWQRIKYMRGYYNYDFYSNLRKLHR